MRRNANECAPRCALNCIAWCTLFASPSGSVRRIAGHSSEQSQPDPRQREALRLRRNALYYPLLTCTSTGIAYRTISQTQSIRMRV